MSENKPSPRWQRRTDERPGELLDAALGVLVENKAKRFKAAVRNFLVVNPAAADLALADVEGSSRAPPSLLLGELAQRMGDSALSGIFKLSSPRRGLPWRLPGSTMTWRSSEGAASRSRWRNVAWPPASSARWTWTLPGVW